MSQTELPLKGPDFKNGVPLETLKSGQKLLGHADGQPVLLIREEDLFYALGAKCSHYGGDLNDGLLSDGIVRCPWHHACFDIKTGEALKAPALNAVPTWKTEVVNGMVFVREQKIASSPTATISNEEHFVIIGSGAAGHAASERLRRLGFSGRITILSADSDLPYDRPNLSKDYLAGNAPEEWMPLRSADFFSTQKISIRLGTKVQSIDPKTKRILLEDGNSIDYDKCLIATGGSPVKPEIAGIDLPHVHFLRSFADCRRLIGSLEHATSVAIIGAGFIGLEAAAALKARKLDVCVVAPSTFPLEHAVGPEVGRFLKEHHEHNGVRFRLGQSVKRIEKNKVTLRDNTAIQADVVLIATGVKPITGFAEGSELQLKDGFLVNEYLETNVPDIFAAGDAARYSSPFSETPLRIEHWVVAQRQGQTAAANMMGLHKKYADVPFFWSQQFDLVLNYVGMAAPLAAARVYGKLADKNCAVTYSQNGVVKAVLTMGRDLQNLEIEKAFERGDQRALEKILKENN